MRGGNNITTSKPVENKTEKEKDFYFEYAETWKEIANMSGIFGQSSSGTVANVKVEDLLTYLRNPYGHLKQIRNTSRYLNNKHGVIKDVNRMFKNLPTLKYSLNWSVENSDDIDKHESTVNDFLEQIDVIKFMRDGLYEVAVDGTIVPVLRSKKYIQFLEIDDLKIDKIRDGKWVVEFDLASLDQIRDHQDRLNKIASLPDEVTEGKYATYKNSKNDTDRYIELKNCEVVALDGMRNFPYGLPYTIGAWIAILQKEMIDSVEKSIAERLLTQILVLKAGHYDKEGTRPVDRELITHYFNEVSKLLQQKEGASRGGGNSSKINGSGLIAFPSFFDLNSLQIDTTMFTKEIYEKITDDILMNLGVSRALVFGEGGNYSSAQVNSEKIFSYVFAAVEEFERVINSFIKLILPKNVSCRIKFDKSTVLDKQTEIKNKKDLFMQTSLVTPWAEAVMDMPIKDIVEQRKFEEKLKLDELFYPAKNAHTTSGNETGRPAKENDEIDNENTARSRSSNGNENPRPSK